MIDLTEITPGRIFGRLTVTCPVTPQGGKLLCLCSCGNEKIALRRDLVSGKAISCGCIRNRYDRGMKKPSLRHGMARSPEYRIWCAVVTRCFNANSKDYHRYGGAGITMCDRWRHSFEAFLADMGPRPSLGHTIDRFPDGAGNYEPGNCRWATPSEQARNRKSNTIYTIEGVGKCLSEWAETYNVDAERVRQRVRAGWDIEKALATPGISTWKKRDRRKPLTETRIGHD